MTDTFKEIGSLFGREGAGAGFAKQTDKESFTYAFAWPEGGILGQPSPDT